MHLTVFPTGQRIEVPHPAPLTDVLRSANLYIDVPCGGMGKCGKCTVLIDGEPALACRTTVDRDMTVTLPQRKDIHVLTDGIDAGTPRRKQNGYLIALDIGTTTVAAFLLDGSGEELNCASCLNPQTAFGADVISRIQYAVRNGSEPLCRSVRDCVTALIASMCEMAGIAPAEITTVSMVGNPAMQQLFLGISPENLTKIPFSPVLTEAKAIPASDYLPICKNASILIVPDIAGFTGADTVAGILATGMDKSDEISLLVDIGTNGEMVLGSRSRLIACSTAAGPALEGANIQCGMRGQTGAMDHVWVANGKLHYSVIGNTEATGICGTGLIDAIAAALDLGLLNERGRILNESRTISLSSGIYLTQEDIRQVQTAKGAIAAGIALMAKELSITTDDIQHVYLAGAFGTYMNPHSACRIGLLPPELEHKITSVGNAAGSGAKRLAQDSDLLAYTQILTDRIAHLELASHPDFRRCFAKHMRF
jgi:uncharacterized 2Fe-2S/4Fe-4S cluster protein (DUF4445 family)